MRSIEDTLRTVQDIIKKIPVKVSIALVGGYAVIIHGAERTTIDIDFCLYSDIVNTSSTRWMMLKRPKPLSLQNGLAEIRSLQVSSSHLLMKCVSYPESIFSNS